MIDYRDITATCVSLEDGNIWEVECRQNLSFNFENLPRGSYRITPNYHGDDGYVFVPSSQEVEIINDNESISFDVTNTNFSWYCVRREETLSGNWYCVRTERTKPNAGWYCVRTEQEIVDGNTYLLDMDGNRVLDKDGDYVIVE
jgi:hypothetical protein